MAESRKWGQLGVDSIIIQVMNNRGRTLFIPPRFMGNEGSCIVTLYLTAEFRDV